MKKISIATLNIAIALLAACTTRSISDSGYEAGRGNSYGSYGSYDSYGAYGAYGAYGRNSAAYPSELSEFDVLGIERGASPTDDEIKRVLASHKPFALKRGSRVMLLQSGALIPDSPMTAAMSKYFSVGVFSGQPSMLAAKTGADGGGAESYSRSLKLAAARGGLETLVVYWGLLESARENMASASVSWVPVVGWVLPDEKQRMRIRLKVAVVDVASGQWEMFSPDAIDDGDTSSMLSRKTTDQSLVNSLKEKAYVAAVEDLVKRFSR